LTNQASVYWQRSRGRGKKSGKDWRFHREEANGRVSWDLCAKAVSGLSRLSLKARITWQIVIDGINEIVKILDKPTVIVIDNAPIDRSEEFEESIEEWEQKRLAIYYLPTSSSELNTHRDVVEENQTRMVAVGSLSVISKTRPKN